VSTSKNACATVCTSKMPVELSALKMPVQLSTSKMPVELSTSKMPVQLCPPQKCLYNCVYLKNACTTVCLKNACTTVYSIPTRQSACDVKVFDRTVRLRILKAPLQIQNCTRTWVLSHLSDSNTNFFAVARFEVWRRNCLFRLTPCSLVETYGL
jgi:hypothetical protein